MQDHDHTAADLRAEVNQLRRQVRRSNAATLAVVVVLGAAFLVGGKSEPETLRGRRLVLTDSKGAEQVEINAGTVGTYPSLRLGQVGERVFIATANGDGSRLIVEGSDRSSRVVVGPRAITIAGAPDAGPWAVLGEVEPIDASTGAEARSLPNALTLFGRGGKVLFQAP